MTTPDGKDMNVLSKTPEEIKNGLECCGKGNACRGHCPYDGPENDINGCTGKLSRDALTLINRLEGDNIAKAIVLDRLERERDAAIEDMRNDPHCCFHCKYRNGIGREANLANLDGDCFEWRGAKEE